METASVTRTSAWIGFKYKYRLLRVGCRCLCSGLQALARKGASRLSLKSLQSRLTIEQQEPALRADSAGRKLMLATDLLAYSKHHFDRQAVLMAMQTCIWHKATCVELLQIPTASRRLFSVCGTLFWDRLPLERRS